MQENYFTRETLKAALEAKGITSNAQAQPVIDAMIKKGAIIQGINEPKTVVDKLVGRAKDLGGEIAAVSTLGASTIAPEDIAMAKGDKTQQDMLALQGGLRAAQAPIRAVGAVGGAIGDVIGAGLEATGIDKAIGSVVSPVVQNPNVQKAVDLYKSLPQDTQDVLGAILNTANIPLGGVGASAVKSGVESGVKAVAGAGSKAVKAVTPDASSIMQRVARIPKQKQIKFQNTAGESVGEYLTKRGVYGDEEQIVEQLYKRFTDSKKVADDALEQLPGTFKPQQVADALDMLEEKFTKSSTKGVKDPNLSRVEELIAKYNAEGLTMPEVNEAKRLFEKNAKLDFARENNPDGIRLANNVDNSIREWQFNQAEQLGLKNLPEINRETRLARQLMDDLGAESAGIAGNNAVSLTDWIVLAEGNPASIAAFLGKKAAASKKLQSAVAKKVAGAPTVGQPEAIFTNAKKTTSPLEQKILPESLPKSTPTTPKSKGIRGMVNPSELVPKKKVVSSLEQEAKGKTLDEFVNSFEKRFHQTSPEIESKIQKEGFKIGNLGSGSSDVLPVGVNTKMTNEELSLLAKGSQVESYFPKNTKIKTFESRNDAEQFFKDNILAYWENMNKVSELDAKNVKIHKEMMRRMDDIASTNPGREVIRNENNKIKVFLENWQNEDLALLKKAQEASTKYAKEQGWDVLQINKDVGGFNRVTDNTIVLNPKLLKTKQQLTNIWNKANGTLEQEAKKYKSAEEFVKEQGTPVYHGGSVIDKVNLSKSNFDKTFYTTDVKDYAKSYGGKNSNINEMFISPEAKLIDLRNPTPKQVEDLKLNIEKVARKVNEVAKYGESFSFYPYSTSDVINGISQKKAHFIELPQIKQVLREMGYDGVITQEAQNAKNIGIWNKDVIKTKSQLTDTWKKANGTLEQEAKGYKSVKDIKQSFPKVDISVYEGNGEINLSKIVVPKNERGTGIGSKIMKDLISYADETKQKIVLTPSSDFGGTKSRLIDFYKRFGFVENKSKTKDFSTRETMYRNPK